MFLLGLEKIKIIDCTFVENNQRDIRSNEVGRFIKNLTDCGVDLFELSLSKYAYFKNFIQNDNIMMRIEKSEDIEYCREFNIRNIVIEYGSFKKEYIQELISKNIFNVSLSFEIMAVSEFEGLVTSMSQLHGLKNIRLNSMINFYYPDWVGYIEKIKKEFSVEIQLCPYNSRQNAVAIIIEGITNGAGCFVSTFTGDGEIKEFAPLEEVLAALNFIVLKNRSEKDDKQGSSFGGNFDSLRTLETVIQRPAGIPHFEEVGVLPARESDKSLSMLRDLKNQFESIFLKKIPYDKPIIGDGIFYFESGIHADGIAKNPENYEPFKPELVGLTRQMFIGKHSGTSSLKKKLAELGYTEIDGDKLCLILENVREESMKKGRALLDFEIENLYLQLEQFSQGCKY